MANIFGRQVVLPLVNKSGGQVIAGDVVIIDTSNDSAFTTTTSAAFTGGVGVAQETIASNATGRVLIAGYAALVNVSASVTRGQYGTTHTVAKQAVGTASRGAGVFAQWLTGGTTPIARIFSPDLAAAAGNVASDAIWDAAGDLAVGTGADTAARKAIGSTGDVLNVSGGTIAWTAPGTLWAPASGNPALTAGSVNPTLGTGGTTGHRYLQIGKLVLVWGNITFGSSGVAAGSGEYYISLPVTAHALGGAAMGSAVLYDSSAGAFNLAVTYVQSTTVLRLAITGTSVTVHDNAPWTWAANDQINYFAAYEAA